jgi:very-short-patch-repair endonuclease
MKLDFVKRARNIHGDRYSYDLVEYVNSHTKVKIICKEHGAFYQLPYVHTGKQKSICPKCAKFNSTEISKKDRDKFIEEANIIHNNRYIYDEVIYQTNKVKVIVICKKHGDFEVSPNSHLSQKIGCPVCKISRGEENITKVLCNFGINFIRKYKFDDCVFKNRLEFDFYLPDQNICIEYDGEQHFKEVSFFKNNFEIGKIRDSIKDEYCRKNSIKLIRISYLDINEVDKILNEHLSDFKDINSSKEFIIENYEYLTYAQASEWIKSNYPNVKSQNQFKKWKSGNLYYSKIPKNPYSVYRRSNEWVSWSEFLGSNNISGIEISKKYISYNSAKEWIKNNLNCDELSISKWKELYRSGTIPDFIPRNPNTFYSNFNRGWISYADFLNNKSIATVDKKFISYNDAKKWLNVNRPDIKTQKQWRKYYKEFCEDFNIPTNPYRTYGLSNEWVSWSEFLNNIN